VATANLLNLSRGESCRRGRPPVVDELRDKSIEEKMDPTHGRENLRDVIRQATRGRTA
jgi:hypothetical protein